MKVLLAEDEFVVAFDLEAQIAGLGHEVVAASSVAEALAAAEAGGLDAAVLDVSLADGAVWPVLDMLSRRGVPFVLLTGHNDDILPPAWRAAPLLSKPVDPVALVRELALLGGEPAASPAG